MKKALNDQVLLESSASNNYLAMASWCEVTGYQGAANYFYAQSDEERTHMLKIVHFLNSLGATATIPATKAPTSEPIVIFELFIIYPPFFVVQVPLEWDKSQYFLDPRMPKQWC